MEKSLRILQLAPRYAFPTDDGGKIGIANITRQFAAAGAEVTFFCFYEEEIPEEHKLLIRPFAELHTYKHSTRNTIPRIIGSLFRRISLYFSKHYQQEAVDYLIELHQEKQFDVIHADHSCMMPIALELKSKLGIPVGLRLHNIEWIIWQRYTDVTPLYNPKRLYVGSQARKLRKDEINALNQADAAFAITDIDRKRAIELCPNLNVIIASAGVDTKEWLPDDNISRNGNELILATLYHWRHNVDGLRWFIDQVMPELYKNDTNAKLSLIGKDAPSWLDNFRHIGVNLIGYVDSVQPYLNRAGIYISPLFVGGGIRIKILEAMAMKLPVIATSVAAEGIKAGPESGLIICDTREQFIRAITDLMRHPEKRDSLGEKARLYVSENHSWKKNVALMLDEYRHLAISKHTY